jgi:hypothetical protein
MTGHGVPGCDSLDKTAMRFSKGSIELSSIQDMQLLRQVVHSKFVTHDQLFEFMTLGAYENKKASFNWRVRRLAEHGFLERHYLPEISKKYVYRIGARSKCFSEFATLLPLTSRKQVVDSGTCTHSIELNEIHLSLARELGVLKKWVSETAIVSQNVLTTSGYAKDYDAVVTVKLGDVTSTFALEYERTPKRKSDYMAIRERLQSEREVGCFLYLAATRNLLSFLIHCFANLPCRLYLGLSEHFLASPMDTPVLDTLNRKRIVLRTALTLQ